MKKALKITGIVAGVLVALFAVLAVAAKLLITPERVKQTVVPLAEKKLNRKLQLGEINIGLFSGIGLKDVTVMEKDGTQPFLQAREAKLKYQFWPLLQKKVIVDAVSLEGVNLRVVRMPDGTFNYSDILAKKEVPEQAKPPEKEELNLVVSKVEVSDSEVRFEDRKVPSGPPAVYTLKDLDISATDISMQDPFPIKIDAEVFATEVEIEVKIANASNKPSLEGTVRVPEGDLKKIVAALPPSLAAKARQLNPSGTAKVELNLSGPVSAPKGLLKSGTIAVDGEFFATAVEIDAKLTNPANNLSMTGTVRVPGGDLKKIVAALPPSLAAKARGLDPTGVVKADLSLAGPVSAPKQLLKGGTVNLSKVQVTASGQRPTLEGNLALRGDQLSSRDLSVTLGENKLNIAFTVAHLLARPLVVTSAVKADTFNIDPFLKKGAAPPAGRAPAQAKPEPAPKNLPVQASGTVQIGKSAYKGLPVTGLYLKYRLASNVLTVDDLRGNVAGGSFSDSARIDLARQGLAYSTRLVLKGVQAEPVLKAFSPKMVGRVSGALTLNADLRGAGTQGDAMLRNLAGQGNFDITGGRITGTKLLNELSVYLKAPELREINFNTFAGNFRMEGGKVLLDSTIASKDLQTVPKGTIGLVDKGLDLSLPTRLSPQLTARIARGGVAKHVTDEKGWGILPLKATGTTAAPKVRVDAAAVTEQLKGKAQEKIEKTLEEKIFKKKEGETPRPEQELLEKGLRGIFGR